jgi:hypothetical protein
MMAYANNYVVSVLVNDKPQREFNVEGKRSIQMSFDTEYKIRLKNQTNVRAMVNVSIDGASVFMGGKQLILEPRQSLDLERFVGELESGRKFKFVKQEKLGESGHFDPTSDDLGKLSVEFVPEMELRLGHLSTITTTSFPTTYNPWINVSAPNHWWGSSQIYCATNASYNSIGVQGTQGPSGDKGIVATSNCSEIPLGKAQACSLGAQDTGGTVEGGISNQSFRDNNSLILWDYSKKTTIDIQMTGPSKKVELTKAEQLAKKFYDEYGGNYNCAPRDIQKALAFVVEKTILHTVLNK